MRIAAAPVEDVGWRCGYFFSLDELNAAIRELLEDMCAFRPIVITDSTPS